MKKLSYIVDIDGTICQHPKGNRNKYRDAVPLRERIAEINDLYIKGHTIIYFTARGMGRHNNDRQKAYDEFYDFTLKQLCSWGCMFNDLWLGKPSGDFYIDDKGINSNDFFKNWPISET